MTGTKYIIVGGILVLFALSASLSGALAPALLLGLPGAFFMIKGLVDSL